MNKILQIIVSSGAGITLLAAIPFFLKPTLANAQSLESAVVFEPPSNVRVKPNGRVLCSVNSETNIGVYGYNNGWYKTDVCGKSGYIHQSQVLVQLSGEVTEACNVVSIQTRQLALRFTPNGKSRAGLSNGNVVLPIREQGTWSYVRVLSGANKSINGLEGWVNSNYLSCS